MRIGHGYDVPAGDGPEADFGRWTSLIIWDCWPFGRDVVTPRLGWMPCWAAALGDIGQHFPDTDPAYQVVSTWTCWDG